MKRFNINLPDKVYEKLREYSFREHQPMSKTVVAALTTMAFFAEKSKDLEITSKIKEDAGPLVKDLKEMFPEICRHGKGKTFCTISNCPNYASWK